MLNTEQLAERLGVSSTTIRRHVRLGVLPPACRFGRGAEWCEACLDRHFFASAVAEQVEWLAARTVGRSLAGRRLGSEAEALMRRHAEAVAERVAEELVQAVKDAAAEVVEQLGSQPAVH